MHGILQRLPKKRRPNPTRRSIGLCQRVAKTVSSPCCRPGLAFGPQPQRCAYLIVRSSSWLLFFFFFSTARLPLRFQKGGIRSLRRSSGGRASSRRPLPPPASPLRSLSPSPAVLHRPQQLSLSFLHANPSGLLSSTPPLLSSSHLISPPPTPPPQPPPHPVLFKVSARALSQVLEGRNLAWFFRPV